jgi:hypothetical protein
MFEIGSHSQPLHLISPKDPERISNQRIHPKKEAEIRDTTKLKRGGNGMPYLQRV